MATYRAILVNNNLLAWVDERPDLDGPVDVTVEIVEEPSWPELSPEIRAKLQRRLDEYDQNPDEGEPWEVVRDEIQRELDEQRARRSSTTESVS